ncbi:MAG TPA: hypothetical protein VNW47_00525 [Terriglobales bacterium]|jgi:hypothetical protein|nr:hypothetical protein [Terriglobales bacterium]
MRCLRYILCLSFLITLTHAQSNQTDAQRDDLAGPVKSVSTNTKSLGVRWQQPGGPTLLLPIWCRDCYYDPDGSKTRSGQATDGEFSGETIRLVRDANGNVIERFANTAVAGLYRYERVGPFGNIEQVSYQDGKVLVRSKFSYDEYGHMTEWLSFDAQGNSTGRSQWKRLPQGDVTEQSSYGKDGELQWQQTWDPETTEQRFTAYDESGKAKQMWTAIDGKPTSFWDGSDDPSPFGAGFSAKSGENDVDDYVFHKDGNYERSRIHFEYLGPDKRNMLSGEWRDAQGKLLLGVYYEYEIDSFRNWTERQVRVWSPDLGEKTLYEVDSRKITYWKK